MRWLCLLLLFAAEASAAGTDWLIERRQPAPSVLGGGDSLQRELTRLQGRYSAENVAFSGQYEYRILDIEGGQPAHNGHLHQLGLSLSGQGQDWQWSLSSGVNGSSNSFANQRFHRDHWVLTGGILRSLPETNAGQFSLGLAGDYRFGGFRAYPRLDVTAEVAGLDWQLQAPVMLAVSDADQRWRLALERVGSKWGVFDRSLAVESAVYLSQWQLTAEWRLGATGPLDWRLAAGHDFSSRLVYTDLALGRVQDTPSSQSWVGIRLAF